MWAVALTDAIQIILVAIGVIVVGVAVVMTMSSTEVKAVALTAKPDVSNWIAIAVVTESLAIGALGNLSGQDLIQRILSAKSSRDARRACFVSGGAYWILGGVPVFLGLAAAVCNVDDQSVVMGFAGKLLHPAGLIVFVIAVVSAVLSTIDSAILSPAGIIAQNMTSERVRKRVGELTLNRLSCLVVAFGATLMAFLGEDAYSLLESAYSLTLVGLFVPFIAAFFVKRPSRGAAMTTLILGTLLWLIHMFYGEDEWFGGSWLTGVGIYLPESLSITLICGVVFGGWQLVSNKNSIKERNKGNEDAQK
ncbi:MAG: hypothetical protein R3C03_08415 [Pirellulaceae bacterium]